MQRPSIPPASTGVHVSPTPEQKLQAGQRHDAAPDGPVKIRAGSGVDSYLSLALTSAP
jgi:hypothetical protein